MDDKYVVVVDDLMDRIIDEQETRLAEENTDTASFAALTPRGA